MIYQLKVSLSNSSVPIWRRVLVPADRTFFELHQIIQVVMNWPDSCLHIFEFDRAPIGKIREVRTSRLSAFFQAPAPRQIAIGHPKFEDKGFQYFNEYEETLAAWLLQEKEAFRYTYDFNEDLKHEIIVEKILSTTDGEAYPRCIELMGWNPKGVYEHTQEEQPMDTEAQPRDDKKLIDINKRLEEAFVHNKNLEIESNAQPALPKETSKEEWQTLFKLITEFRDLKSWQWLRDTDIFALEDPETKEIAYCSVIGQSGKELGLSLYLGTSGLRALNLTIFDRYKDIDPRQILHIQRSILLSFMDRSELDQEDYKLIQNAGLSFRGKKQWPCLRSFVPGHYPWLLDQAEVLLLTNLLPQIIKVCKRAKQNPSFLKSVSARNVFAYLPMAEEDREGDEIIWVDGELTLVLNEDDIFEPFAELKIDELSLRRLKKELKESKEIVEFDFFYSPEPVQERANDRPIFPYIFLWMNQRSGQIIHHQMIIPEQLEKYLYEDFISLLRQIKYKPHTLLVEREDAYELLQTMTEQLGIKLKLIDELPTLREAKKEMFDI